MFDKRQMTVPTGVGIAGCELGVMNGTKPGFWAAEERNEESNPNLYLHPHPNPNPTPNPSPNPNPNPNPNPIPNP